MFWPSPLPQGRRRQSQCRRNRRNSSQGACGSGTDSRNRPCAPVPMPNPRPSSGKGSCSRCCWPPSIFGIGTARRHAPFRRRKWLQPLKNVPACLNKRSFRPCHCLLHQRTVSRRSLPCRPRTSPRHRSPDRRLPPPRKRQRKWRKQMKQSNPTRRRPRRFSCRKISRSLLLRPCKSKAARLNGPRPPRPRRRAGQTRRGRGRRRQQQRCRRARRARQGRCLHLCARRAMLQARRRPSWTPRVRDRAAHLAAPATTRCACP